MKKKEKVFKHRLETKDEDKYVKLEDASDILKDIAQLHKKISEKHGVKKHNIYLKSAQEECLQFEMIFEVFKDDDDFSVKLDEDFADIITNSFSELLNIKTAFYQNFEIKGLNDITTNIVLRNDNGEEKEFSRRNFDLIQDKNLDSAFDNFFQKVKSINNITHFKTYDENNNLMSEIKTSVIPRIDIENTEQEDELFYYVSKNTRVDIVKLPLSGDSRSTWSISFIPKQPDGKDALMMIETKMENIKIKDTDFNNKIKSKEISFKHGDQLMCDIEIYLQINEGSFCGNVKKATILEVSKHIH